MSKHEQLLNQLGSNMAESMGANRTRSGQVPVADSTTTSNRHDGCARLRSAAEIQVDRIVPDPNQPRDEFDPDAIQRLADSLQSHGQLQPICVRWAEDLQRYVIVTGERRWRAALQAGRPSVSAIILEEIPDESRVLEMQLIENALREDLKPIEQAKAYKALMDRNAWSAARLASVLHINDSSVIRSLALLDLPEAVQSRVEHGQIAPSVGYELTKLDDPAEQQRLADQVVTQNLSRAETVEAVRQSRPAKRASSTGKGRGGIRPRKPLSRVFRLPGGKVTVEWNKGSGDETLRGLLLEALRRVSEGARETASDDLSSAA